MVAWPGSAAFFVPPGFLVPSALKDRIGCIVAQLCETNVNVAVESGSVVISVDSSGTIVGMSDTEVPRGRGCQNATQEPREWSIKLDIAYHRES